MLDLKLYRSVFGRVVRWLSISADPKCRIAGLLQQTLAYPVGSQYVYSDLSMITMMYVIGKLARVHGLVTLPDLLLPCAYTTPHGPWQDQCYYEAFVRRRVLGNFSLRETQFLPPQAWWPRCAPTWNDTDGFAPGGGYRHRWGVLFWPRGECPPCT